MPAEYTHEASLAVLHKEGRILLQGRANICKWGEEWALFGGRVEEGESPEEAVARELQEELELDFPHPEILGSIVAPHGDHNTKVHYSEKELDGTEKLFLHEGSEMKYFTFEEAKSLKLHPAHHKIINIVEKILND